MDLVFMIKTGKRGFESERVSDEQTIETIKQFYSMPTANGTANGTVSEGGYILDSPSVIGAAASLRSIKRTPAGTRHISLATAHPAKFADAVDLALKNESGVQLRQCSSGGIYRSREKEEASKSRAKRCRVGMSEIYSRRRG
jgi:threonine synthase